MQAGCSADAEDSPKVKADRMTGVSTGTMTPRLSGLCLGGMATRAGTGAERLLVEMHLQLGADPATTAGEMVKTGFEGMFWSPVASYVRV